MKKILFLLFATSAGALSAQTVIPRVGFVLSSSSFDPPTWSESSETKSQTGYSVGIAYEYVLSEKFSIQPEVSFVRKGFSYTEYNFGDGYQFKDEAIASLNYLEVPVLAKYKFGGISKFYVNAGPSVGLGLGGKYKTKSYMGQQAIFSTSGKIKFEDRPVNYDGPDQYVDHKLDFALQLGGGFIFKNKILLDVRYGVSVSDIMESTDSKNRALQVSVGVPLNLF